MRSCTIVKALVLAIGAIAVVARSPRVQRQEINARAGRGYGFSNSLTKNDGADAKDTTARGFEGIDQVLVSESLSDEDFDASSIPTNPTISKRGDRNIETAKCLTACRHLGTSNKPNPDDCALLYNDLYSRSAQFTVAPHDRQTATNQTCGAALVNNSPDTITYNFFTFGGTTQWLNGNCIMQNGVAGGKCIFQDDAQNDPPTPDIYVAIGPSDSVSVL